MGTKDRTCLQVRSVDCFVALLDLVFLVLCFVGFLLQVYDISNTYFSFPTSTLVSVEMRNELLPPDLTLCIRYVDVFSDDSLRQLFNSSVNLNKSSAEVLQFVQNLVTM